MNKKSRVLLSKLLLIFGLIVSSLILQPNVAQGYSNKPIHWGFSKSKNQQPPSAGKEYDQLLERYGGFYIGDTKKKNIYLTFDNGYENGYTAKILDILKRKKSTRYFFHYGALSEGSARLS